MKLAIIVPQNQEDWQQYILPELHNLRHKVLMNNCTEDCDFLICMTHNQTPLTKFFHEQFPKIPLITYNWDWYDYIDKNDDERGYWLDFIKLMKESVDVWSSSKTTAKKCEKDTGIKSDFYGYANILPWEWNKEIQDWGYVVQSSRKDPNKRFHWFTRACEELDIPYKITHPKETSRPEYIRAVSNCSFMISSSVEESIGGLTLMEASYLKKPIFVGNHDSAKEVWDENATYFKVHDYEDYKKQLKWLWENYKSDDVRKKAQKAQQIVKENFLPEIRAKKMHDRLLKIISHSK